MRDSLCRKRKLADSFTPCEEDLNFQTFAKIENMLFVLTIQRCRPQQSVKQILKRLSTNSLASEPPLLKFLAAVTFFAPVEYKFRFTQLTVKNACMCNSS